MPFSWCTATTDWLTWRRDSSTPVWPPATRPTATCTRWVALPRCHCPPVTSTPAHLPPSPPTPTPSPLHTPDGYQVGDIIPLSVPPPPPTFASLPPDLPVSFPPSPPPPPLLITDLYQVGSSPLSQSPHLPPPHPIYPCTPPPTPHTRDGNPNNHANYAPK